MNDKKIFLFSGLCFIGIYLIIRHFQKMKKLQLQNRVLMVKSISPKIAVVSYDNRSNQEIELLKNVNQTYCDKQGYDFYFFHQYPQEDIYPPYWLKVKMIQNFLKAPHHYDYVMWMDSDACFHNHELRIEQLLSPNDSKNMFIKSSELGPFHFNAGIWMVQNSNLGHAFMQDWLDLYQKENWMMQKDGKWGCKAPLITIPHIYTLKVKCPWSEFQYEQGSGNYLLNTEKYKDHYVHIDSEVMQKRTPYPRSFTIHFYLDAKKNIVAYCQKYHPFLKKKI